MDTLHNNNNNNKRSSISLAGNEDATRSLKQLATFISNMVAKRVDFCHLGCIEHEGHLVHVHVCAPSLATLSVCVMDAPSRVAVMLLMKYCG